MKKTPATKMFQLLILISSLFDCANRKAFKNFNRREMGLHYGGLHFD